MIEVELVGVRVELPSNTPIVAVREVDGPRLLSIFIGAPEATAISFALEGVDTPRPLTHDLMRDVFEALDVVVLSAEITALKEATFFAELHLESNGVAYAISARPSDALAIAARVGCPVFVAPEVMDEAAVVEVRATESDDDSPEAVVEEFKNFIDQVDPEDFES